MGEKKTKNKTKNHGFTVEPGVCSSGLPTGGDECCSEMPIEVSNGWTVTTCGNFSLPRWTGVNGIRGDLHHAQVPPT